MKFRSPTDEPFHIALTSGHTFVVGTELTEVPPLFRREAIARGCLPEGDEAPVLKGENFNRAEVIASKLQAMLDGETEGDFKPDGSPNLVALMKRTGFRVSREEVEPIWEELKPSGTGGD